MAITTASWPIAIACFSLLPITVRGTWPCSEYMTIFSTWPCLEHIISITWGVQLGSLSLLFLASSSCIVAFALWPLHYRLWYILLSSSLVVPRNKRCALYIDRHLAPSSCVGYILLIVPRNRGCISIIDGPLEWAMGRQVDCGRWNWRWVMSDAAFPVLQTDHAPKFRWFNC